MHVSLIEMNKGQIWFENKQPAGAKTEMQVCNNLTINNLHFLFSVTFITTLIKWL